MLILLFLITQCQAISQLCNSTSTVFSTALDIPSKLSNGTCPLNSHCLSNNYCACNRGFVGGCTQNSYPMQDGSVVSATVTNLNYTFFSVVQDIDSYVVLVF